MDDARHGPGLQHCAMTKSRHALDGKPFAGVSVSRRYDEGNLGDITKLGEQAGETWTGSTHLVSDGNPVPLPRRRPRSESAGTDEIDPDMA
jgi:hypothetical protein